MKIPFTVRPRIAMIRILYKHGSFWSESNLIDMGKKAKAVCDRLRLYNYYFFV